MKRILLGSTALVAAGMIAGGAAQAENAPIAVSVGGYYQSAFAVIDENSDAGESADETSSTAFGEDVEININGNSTLDNGLTVGFSAKLEGTGTGSGGSDTLDERFVFFRGNWGQIRVGMTEDARQELTTFQPSGAYIFGVNSPFFRFQTDPFFTSRTYDDGLGDEDSMKIIYFSPSFNGFQFALSYAPNDGGPDQYQGNTRSGAAGDATGSGALLDQLSAGVAFDHDFGGFKLRLSSGYSSYNLDRCNTTAASQACDDSPDSLFAGGTISVGKFSFGGGYMHQNLVAQDSLAADRDRQDYNVGVAYWDAMWGVGVEYGAVRQESLTAGEDQDYDLFAINGSYILGPGVSLSAQIDVGDGDDDAVGSLDTEWVTFMVGSSLNF